MADELSSQASLAPWLRTPSVTAPFTDPGVMSWMQRDPPNSIAAGTERRFSSAIRPTDTAMLRSFLEDYDQVSYKEQEMNRSLKHICALEGEGKHADD
jgi:hypothetical protein